MPLPAPKDPGIPFNLLDRLLDDDPADAGDPVRLAGAPLNRMKGSMARDLEELLNSRRLPEWELEGFPRCADSVLAFGIQDLGAFNLKDPRSLRALQEHLRRTIERFEPRLGSVRITLEPGREPGKALRFRVDAVLRQQPGRPPVIYDATMHLGTQTCLVQQR
jgi:type VI secretion system protein ImpF